jgi:hypothetical protein
MRQGSRRQRLQRTSAALPLPLYSRRVAILQNCVKIIQGPAQPVCDRTSTLLEHLVAIERLSKPPSQKVTVCNGRLNC